MGMSINSRMSGFRKWSEAHQPKAIDEARTGANQGGVIAAAGVDHGGTTPDQQPHRPWLVPGVGKL
jgi:hypothetical protein